MPERRKRPEDEADAWFYDLGLMAKRVEANEKRAHLTARRQWVVVAFVLFSFLLLAWRSEVNSDRISRNSGRIEQNQNDSCLRGVVILERFNAQQAALAALARSRNDVTEAEVYEGFRIDPLPTCEDVP